MSSHNFISTTTIKNGVIHSPIFYCEECGLRMRRTIRGKQNAATGKFVGVHVEEYELQYPSGAGTFWGVNAPECISRMEKIKSITLDYE